MIRIASIEIRGKSDRGDFIGRLEFAPGLQVISGRNNFGKTLAAESIAWCLNLETIFGRKESESRSGTGWSDGRNHNRVCWPSNGSCSAGTDPRYSGNRC